MHFTTVAFAAFFLVTLAVSWAIRRRRTAQKLWLLAASWFFFAAWDLRFVQLLLASSLIDWIAVEGLTRTDRRWARNAWLAASVAGNLATLGFFKYYEFFRGSFADLLGALGLASHLPVLQVALPLGISFYTFQSLAYTVDVWRGHAPKARSLLDFLLFMSLFPQLVIGPICRSRDLLPQLEAEHPAAVPDVSRAVSLIASGFFKKVVIATFLQTHLVDDAFATPEDYSALELMLALYAYTIQVYCDFSGYTDIALGTGLLLGFHLPDNFAGPYASTDIGEFWRRWHITFSTWLRDYVYFPLGGARAGRLRTYVNLLVTFTVGGLWHGASWGFVVWGAIHGTALALHKATLDLRRDLGHDVRAPKSLARAAAGWFYTFHLCVLARVFFRAEDMDGVARYARGLASGTVRGEGFEVAVVGFVLLGLWMNFYGAGLRARFVALHERVPWPLRPLAWLLLAAVILGLKPAGVAPYIYSKF